MPYITREDGERFVIPSYRDVISAKKQSLLKREILLLSTNYGEYITLHRKNVEQYEVAFSPDMGYLLGETVWHYFKRPLDLVYCEAIPNTQEAILVIVKSGSVYLDGTFPIETIPDELVIFRTQQNNFDIYVYGDIPISKTPEAGKFSFDASSVRSFQVLDESVFAKLPKVKNFQLQSVDTVLTSQGIGVLPIKQLLIGLGVLAGLWLLYTYFSTHKKQIPTVFVSYVNPYQIYLDTLTSPDPIVEMHRVYESIQSLYAIPGWAPDAIDYSKGKYHVLVHSSGAKTDLLFAWAKQNYASVEVQQDGFYLSWESRILNRAPPAKIYKLDEAIGTLVDRLSDVLPGNHLSISGTIDKKSYLEMQVTINFTNVSPEIFELIGLQLKNLPLVLNKVSLTTDNGSLTGSIILQALGD
jgi:hypothetical protein